MPEFYKVQSKNWIYGFLGWFTVIYVCCQVAVFHMGEADFPKEIVYFWMFSLFAYATLKEAFRWAGIKNHGVRGEIFAALVIVAFFWMEIYNVANLWLYGIPYRALPGGYFESVMESAALLVAGILSALKYHHFTCGKNLSKPTLPEAKETSVWLG